MGEVKVAESRGVILRLDEPDARRLVDDPRLMARRKGNVVFFEPSRVALDALVAEGHTFDPACRTAWAHFYKKRAEPGPARAFKFKTEPRQHQLDWFNKVKGREYFAFEWEMGLGKTKILLDIAAYKYLMGEIDALLVFSLSDVYDNWTRREIPKHFPIDAECRSWAPTRVQGGMKGILQHKGMIVVAMNFEAARAKKGMEFTTQMVADRKVMLVNDESHNVANMSAQTKAIIKLSDKCVCRFNATGTPVPRDPMNIFPQYRILSNDIFDGMNEWRYKHTFAVTKKNINFAPKDKHGNRIASRAPTIVVGWKNQSRLYETIDPHRSRMLKNDADLPELISMPNRDFDFTKKQRKAYEEIKEKLATEFEGDKMTVANALVGLTRVQQIGCGFYVGDNADPFETLRGTPVDDVNPRIEAMVRWTEEVQGSAIIWSTFRYSLNEIALRLRKEGRNVLEYHGGIDKADRPMVIDEFEKGDRQIFLVASPQTAGSGLTLLQGRDVLFYNHTFRWDQRLQCEARSHRDGQTTAVTLTNLVARNSSDHRVLEGYATKSSIAELLTGDKFSNL